MAIERNAHLDRMDAEFGSRLGTFLSAESDPPRLLMVSSDGWEIVDFVETEERRQSTASIGNATYVMDFPVRRPEVRCSEHTLDALLRHEEFADPRADGYRSFWEERQREEQELLTPHREQLAEIEQQLVEVFRVQAQQTSPLTLDMRRECSNCRGAKQFILNHCLCTSRGIHYLGGTSSPADEQEGAVAKPSDPTPDPDCSDCQGTGRSVSTCPVCAGSGVMPVTQDVTIAGPGDVEFSFRVDAADLVRRGLAIPSAASRLGQGEHTIVVTLSLDLNPLMDAISDTVTEGKPFRVGWYPWETWERGPQVAALTLMADPDRGASVLVGANIRRDEHSLRVVAEPAPIDLEKAATRSLDILQQVLVGGFASTGSDSDDRGASSTRAADLCSTHTHIAAQRRLPCEALLDSMVHQAGRQGLRIALQYSFVAAGEYGPAVYLMGADRIGITEMALGRSWAEVLSKAAARLEAVLARHQAREEKGTQT